LIKLQVWQTGIYAPLTSTGVIVANGFLVSCHSSVVGQQTLHQTFYYAIQLAESLIAWLSGSETYKMQDENMELSDGIQFLLAVLDQIVYQPSVPVHM
jgi:hypothetical protein